MLWVYYSAQIFLLGAEFTRVYAHRYGSRRTQQQTAATAAAGDKSQPSLESRQPHAAAIPQPAMREPAWSVEALAPSRVVTAARGVRQQVHRKPFAAVAIAAAAGLAMAALTGRRARKTAAHA
jgi:ElaB/YqjD/DUF883 family membrane-anchored ribosome-binding protein